MTRLVISSLVALALAGCAIQTSTGPEDRANVNDSLRRTARAIELYEADSGSVVASFDSDSPPHWWTSYARWTPGPGLRIRTPSQSDNGPGVQLIAEGPLVRAFGADVDRVGLTRDKRTVLFAGSGR